MDTVDDGERRVGENMAVAGEATAGWPTSFAIRSEIVNRQTCTNQTHTFIHVGFDDQAFRKESIGKWIADSFFKRQWPEWLCTVSP